jgi:hypothetical protein
MRFIFLLLNFWGFASGFKFVCFFDGNFFDSNFLIATTTTVSRVSAAIKVAWRNLNNASNDVWRYAGHCGTFNTVQSTPRADQPMSLRRHAKSAIHGSSGAAPGGTRSLQ